ncbi:MAG: glycosyl hydrolase [Campylobacterota bacterium]
MTDPFIWDSYSDQPYPIKDKSYKKKMYKKAWFDTLKTALTTLLAAPFIAISYFLFKPKHKAFDKIFGMGVNLDTYPKESIELIKELGVKELLIRLPLWQMDRLDQYLTFVKSFRGCNITLNILQDREHIENLEQTSRDLQKICSLFAPHIKGMQIGNAINRKKWGFASISEYLRFYKVAQDAAKNYPTLSLIGSSTIDFEYHYTIRTLFNGFFIRYDKVASLLYVDRRGAPENTQLGLDLFKKIKLLRAMIKCSLSKDSLIISELNWPISNTAPYAPTSEYECVDEIAYRNYMVRSYLLAIATRSVETIYWHQLIASGYGLVDAREGLRKRDAFDAYRFMLSQLSGARLLTYDFDAIFYMKFQKKDTIIEVFWAKEPTTTTIEGNLYDIIGQAKKTYTIDEAVVYKESRCKR